MCVVGWVVGWVSPSCACNTQQPRARPPTHPHIKTSFPAEAWKGEYKDEGFNGVYFYGVANSWVSNVVFENADIGVVFDQSSSSTVQNVTFVSSRPTSAAQPLQGNTGIMVKVGACWGWWSLAGFVCAVVLFSPSPTRVRASRERSRGGLSRLQTSSELTPPKPKNLGRHTPPPHAPLPLGKTRQSSYDLLVHDFDMQARLLHSVAVSHFSNGNVFSKGRGE